MRAQSTLEQECRLLRRDPRLPGWLGEINSLINLLRAELLPGIPELMETIPRRKLQGNPFIQRTLESLSSQKPAGKSATVNQIWGFEATSIRWVFIILVGCYYYIFLQGAGQKSPVAKTGKRLRAFSNLASICQVYDGFFSLRLCWEHDLTSIWFWPNHKMYISSLMTKCVDFFVCEKKPKRKTQQVYQLF